MSDVRLYYYYSVHIMAFQGVRGEIGFHTDSLHTQPPSHVVPDGVWENDHASLACLEVLGSFHSRSHGGSAGPPTEQPLLPDEPSGVLEGLLVFALEPTVHNRAIKYSGDEVISYSLHLEKIKSEAI